VPVLARVHLDLLVPGGVVEPELVVHASARAREGLEDRHRRCSRRCRWRAIRTVVDAAGHDRPVGVAVEGLDDDLAADTRVPQRALTCAREHLADPHPARARLLREPLLLGIPVEPESYTADLCAFGAADMDLRTPGGRLR